MHNPIRPVEVNALDGYRIWLSYSDGTVGEVDLSHLVDRGVFRLWGSPAGFKKPEVTPHGSIAWDQEVELCPDALYHRAPTEGCAATGHMLYVRCKKARGVQTSTEP